ncbi:MAG: PstS family phosphate ABC transporter substrate-binding protein [Opitutales bacterium]
MNHSPEFLLAFALLAPAVRLAAADAPLAPEVRYVETLPRYAPSAQVSGTIRLWGHGSPKHDFMGRLMDVWIAGFAKFQPGVKFENHMYGTASAIGALYTGAGNLAILGEEISPAATAAFEREKHYPPTGFQIATGSLDVNYFDYAHMIFVQKDNPIPGLTLAQLDGIFGAEHRRGPRNLRTWGDVGLTGAWADRPIQPYGWQVDVDFALFFREAVLEGSHRWNTDLKEFVHLHRPDGSQYDHGQQILDALARDPAGIAISNVRYANPGVRALPLARAAGEPFYAPTPANLIAQTYPLGRIIPAFVDVPPGRSIDPTVREFLHYILSREGQLALIRDSGYLPLGPDAIRRQLEKLP